MDFNDRRALKKANGPSLATGKQYWNGLRRKHGEVFDTKMEAKYGDSAYGSRKERYARAVNKIDQNIKRTGNSKGIK